MKKPEIFRFFYRKNPNFIQQANKKNKQTKKIMNMRC